MQTSNNGISLIKNFEGCRLVAYKPVATEFYFTIGYGHSGPDVKKDMKITQQQADNYLKQDLKKFENAVTATKLKLNQNQFDALVSFTFNCGPGNLQKLIKDRTIAEIGEAIIKYDKAGGKTLAGLTKRRKAEKELFLKPIIEKITQIIKQEPKQEVKEQPKQNGLPYDVKTKCELNIRTAAGTNYPIIRTVKKGTKLTVWAILTSGGKQWGKNGNEWYCLDYCERI